MANMVIMKNSSSAFEIKFPPKCNYKFSEIYVGLYVAHYTHFIRKIFFAWALSDVELSKAPTEPHLMDPSLDKCSYQEEQKLKKGWVSLSYYSMFCMTVGLPPTTKLG